MRLIRKLVFFVMVLSVSGGVFTGLVLAELENNATSEGTTELTTLEPTVNISNDTGKVPVETQSTTEHPSTDEVTPTVRPIDSESETTTLAMPTTEPSIATTTTETEDPVTTSLSSPTTRAPAVPTEPQRPESPDTTVTTVPTNSTPSLSPTTLKSRPPSDTPVDVNPSYPPGEIEPSISTSIFFIFFLLTVCIILVHLMIKFKFKYLPESISFVLIGIVVGLIYHIIQKFGVNFKYQETFSPNSFFLLLLPPIIFESGYSLHKGNFFQNIGSIVLFAVVGTALSTCVVGGGLYGLSKLDVIFQLNLVQSFSFGALISAVDPVATLAIFHALDVNPTLNMLVFGESVLNDAVSIVMTKTILEQATDTTVQSPGMVLFWSLLNFFKMFFVSALIGVAFALCSAVFLKFVNLRKHYSLEFPMWFLFAFAPYFLAEGLKLSGIMAVLFCGIVMSHYTHFNLSPVTQVTVQQIMRSVAFMAETVVFLYIGMQVFTITTSFEVGLIVWSLILILLGRALNIYPLSFLVNRFRAVKISGRMQFIMWFSGLRGAIAYALALNLSNQGEAFGSAKVISVLDTTTLIIVLFTIIVCGGSTLPVLKFLSKGSEGMHLTLSKTEDQGAAVSTHPDEQDGEVARPARSRHQWFLMLDFRFFKPLLVRKFTKQEVHDARIEMQRRTNEWYQGLRAVGSDEEDETSLVETKIIHGIDRGPRERKNASDSTESLLSNSERTSPPAIMRESV